MPLVCRPSLCVCFVILRPEPPETAKLPPWLPQGISSLRSWRTRSPFGDTGENISPTRSTLLTTQAGGDRLWAVVTSPHGENCRAVSLGHRAFPPSPWGRVLSLAQHLPFCQTPPQCHLPLQGPPDHHAHLPSPRNISLIQQVVATHPLTGL